tara:strand:- start:869 stop:1045 length:177 start_codon:yes stop_codon:yes gene_type:complete
MDSLTGQGSRISSQVLYLNPQLGRTLVLFLSEQIPNEGPLFPAQLPLKSDSLKRKQEQ